MSANLLADLDSFYSASNTQNTPAGGAGTAVKQTTNSHNNDFLDLGSWDNSPSQPLSHQPAPPALPAEDSFNDDWGDFESGQQQISQPQVNNVTSWPSTTGTSSATPGAPAPIASNDQQYWPRPSPLHASEKTQPKRIKRREPQRPARDNSVFFDAEDEITDEDEDDEFGDFATSDTAQHEPSVNRPEVTQTPVGLATAQAQLSLLDFADEGAASATAPPQTAMAQPASTDFSWDVFEKPTPVGDASRRFGAVHKASQARPTSMASTVARNAETTAAPKPRSTAQPRKVQNDDAWDDFEEALPTSNIKETPAADSRHPAVPPSSLSFTSMLDEPQLSSSSVPPSNIPPPAVLLSLFTPIIKLAQSQLFDHLAEQNHSINTRNAILEHASTQSFLKSFIALATVLAHIIAGRKLRWKRDTLLAQSMRIGPASASGKSGGMKLAGVDKAENAKEEREVGDVLRVWRAQLGKLRSATTNVGSLPPIPDITESPMVRVLKESEGGVSSSKQCIICALKRNERVTKVDVEVADMFSEWWIDHWGHRTCVAFWQANESKLRSR